MQRLQEIIKIGWRFKRYNNQESKDKIIELLKNTNGLQAHEISKILKRIISTIQEHLRDLKRKGKVFNKRFQRRINNTNCFPNHWFIQGEKNEP